MYTGPGEPRSHSSNQASSENNAFTLTSDYILPINMHSAQENTDNPLTWDRLMTSNQYPHNDRLGATELPEERPVKLTPTTIEEIRAKRGQPMMPTPPSAGEAPPTDQVARLVERVERLEAGLGQKDGVTPEDLADMLRQIKEINSRLDGIMGHLQGTVGYGARHGFLCRNCQSRGYVAARLNCTACGEENWWGWWPRKQ
jgi:hypothetical protein